MKDIIRKMIIMGFPVIFGTYFITKLSISYLIHKELMDFFELLIQSLLFAVVFISFQLLIFYYTLKPRISFLKSGLPVGDRFRNTETNLPLNDEKLNFKDLVESLYQDFVVTYISEENNLIKIREKFRFWSWGAAALIQIDYENNCLKVNAFPFNGNNKKVSMSLTGKIGEILKKI
jgi:hypothetical protein